jgi:hypothetical protein
MLFAIRNVSTVPDVSPAFLAAYAAAQEIQLNQHFCPAWEQTPGKLIVLAHGQTPKSVGATAVVTIYDDADQQGELGDHELVSGLAWGRIFAKTIIGSGGTLHQGNLSVSATLSHELLEIEADPYANWWCDYPDGDVVALESADPVEDECYDVNGIALSNFVTARWFRDGEGPYDWMRTRGAPFEVSDGGYIILRDGGAKFGPQMSIVKKAMKVAPGSRTGRRTGVE